MDEIINAAKNLIKQRTEFFIRNPDIDPEVVRAATDDQEYTRAWDLLEAALSNYNDGQESTAPMATNT